MARFPLALGEGFACLWRHRPLVWALVRRDILGRYRGSVLGILWSFFHPVFMLAIYTFVFSVVFQRTWSDASESRSEFALVLFVGLLVFGFFADCVGRAPGLVVGNTNYVKRVVFPLEILPWVALGSSLFHLLVSFGVWLVFYAIFFGLPHPTVLLLPVLLTPVALITLGVSWALASLGVYLRDVSQIVGILLTALTFLSPIFYPVAAVPEAFQALMHANPMTLAIEMARGALMWGTLPAWGVFGAYLAVALGVAWLGFVWFQKTRRGFADVL